MTSRLALPTILVGAVLALAGCSGNSESTESTETTSAATTTETITETTPETTPAPTRKTITIRVVGGKPVGGIARPKIEKGEKVLLVVRSDVADEVHLHGYDLSRAVAAGGIARIAFVAKIPGRFELELENAGVPLAELTVQ
jgi:ABC-type glycerol-3-phosphate transport system substrate-binding protein